MSAGAGAEKCGSNLLKMCKNGSSTTMAHEDRHGQQHVESVHCSGSRCSNYEAQMSVIHSGRSQPTKLAFNVRPLKFAYFFYEDDFASFDHVVGYLSTQWGGLRNILVPVNQDLE